MDKRMHISDVGDQYRFCVPSMSMQADVSKYDTNGDLRDIGDVAVRALAYFESQFVKNGPAIRKSDQAAEIIATEMMLRLKKLQNAHVICAPFYFSRLHSENQLDVPVVGVVNGMKEVDKLLFNSFNDYSDQYLHENVFKKTLCKNGGGVEWVQTTVTSLTNLCMRKLSIVNRTMAGDSLGAYTVHSTANLYPVKISNFSTKYDQPTVYGHKGSILTSKALSKGLLMLYDVNGWSEWKQSLIWDYHKNDVLGMRFNMNGSAGCRQGQILKVMLSAKMTRLTTPNGKKIDQEVVAKKHVVDLIEKWLNSNQEVDIFWEEYAYCVCFKEENFNNLSDDPKSRKKTCGKCREFFIQNIVDYIFAHLVQHDRQVFERGTTIQVGMVWWHGGAHKLAVLLNYLRPNLFYFDGDVAHFDASQSRPMLEMYNAFAAYYYKPNVGKWRLFQTILKRTCETLSVKLVHIMQRIWYVMFGVMPSGALQTSHGDSWIFGVMFYTFIGFQMIMHPYKADEIMQSVRDKTTFIVVYGDDHIGVTKKELSHLINANAMAQFFYDHFSWEMKDLRNDIPFLSEPDEYGGLKKRGVVFCKMYFVKNTSVGLNEKYPDVLPYRLWNDIIPKIPYGSSDRQNHAGYLLALVGLAYNTMGTNRYAYDSLRIIFDQCLASSKYTSIDDAINDNPSQSNVKDLTKICKKLNLTFEQLTCGFPSYDTITRMNKYDGDACEFKQRVKRYNYMSEPDAREEL